MNKYSSSPSGPIMQMNKILQPPSGPIVDFTNFIWSWAREADKSAVGAVKPAPTSRLGTTVGPDLSWASPIYRPANDLINVLIRIIGPRWLFRYPHDFVKNEEKIFVVQPVDFIEAYSSFS